MYTLLLVLSLVAYLALLSNASGYHIRSSWGVSSSVTVRNLRRVKYYAT